MPPRSLPFSLQLAAALLLGAAVLLTPAGRDAIPLAPWIALMFLLRHEHAGHAPERWRRMTSGILKALR